MLNKQQGMWRNGARALAQLPIWLMIMLLLSGYSQAGVEPVSSPASLIVEQGYIRATLPGQAMTSGYVTLYNPTDTPVTISAAASTQAKRVEIHRLEQVNGLMRMRRQPELVVSSRGRVVMAPGGLHLMLMGLEAPLVPAQTLSVSLTVNGELMHYELPVRSVLDESDAEDKNSNDSSQRHNQHNHAYHH